MGDIVEDEQSPDRQMHNGYLHADAARTSSGREEGGAAVGMKETLEQLLPILQQKITSSTVSVAEIETLLQRFDPATLAPLMEILQHLQKLGQGAGERSADAEKSLSGRHREESQNGYFPDGVPLGFERNGVGNLSVDTSPSENAEASYASPCGSSMSSPTIPPRATNMSMNSPTIPQRSTNMSVNGHHSSDMAPLRDPYWQPSDGDTASIGPRSVENGSVQREWGAGREDMMVRHEDIPANVYNLHPMSQGPPTTADGRVSGDMSESSPGGMPEQLPGSVTIKEEPNASFEELEENAVAGGGMVTLSGRNRGLGKANEPKFVCQICGDVAAGFHCGAYVCEACKKFYLRCLKSGGAVAYTCPKTKECPITKETRSHCQFCRYKKCIDLGMYKPGRDDSRHLRVDFKSIPCKVCGAPSSGFHFGAITCEGCKGFFRRMVKEKLHKKFVCMSGGSCDVASSNRTSCKACRYYKCISIGMALQGTRLGRQSNSVKRTTLIEYQKRHGMSVALFPKLGEEAADQAVAKVEQLLQSKAPEIQLKSEPADNESYGKMPGKPAASPRRDDSAPSNRDTSLSNAANRTELPSYSDFDLVAERGARNGSDDDSHPRRLSSATSVKDITDVIMTQESFCDEEGLNMSTVLSVEGQDVENTHEVSGASQSSHVDSNFAQSDLFPMKDSSHTISSPEEREAANAAVDSRSSNALGLTPDSTMSKPLLGWLNLLSGPDMVEGSQEKLSVAKRALSLPHEPTGTLGGCDIPYKRNKESALWSQGNQSPPSSAKAPLLSLGSRLEQAFVGSEHWENSADLREHGSYSVGDDNGPLSPVRRMSQGGQSVESLRQAGLLTSTEPGPVRAALGRPPIHVVDPAMPPLVAQQFTTNPDIGERMKEFVKHAESAQAVLGLRLDTSDTLRRSSPPPSTRVNENLSVGTGSLNSSKLQLCSPKAFVAKDQLELRERASVGSTLMKKRHLFSHEFRRTNLPIDYRLPDVVVYSPERKVVTAERHEDESDAFNSPEVERNLSEEHPGSESAGSRGGFDWCQLDDARFMCCRVMEAYKELENLNRPRAALNEAQSCSTEKERAWYAAYESFVHHAKYTLRFVKKIPGFKQLPMEDQVTLVREAVYPITLLFHSQFFDPSAKRQRWFCNTDEEREKIWYYFPKFKELNGHIVYSGMLFSELRVTADEYAFLCALMVFSTGMYASPPGTQPNAFMVKDNEKIKRILDSISHAMISYFEETGRDPNRAGTLILRLSELKRANYEHTQIAMQVQRENPDIDFSQLWHEMFLYKT